MYTASTSPQANAGHHPMAGGQADGPGGMPAAHAAAISWRVGRHGSFAAVHAA